jgi:hypothetical protein
MKVFLCRRWHSCTPSNENPLKKKKKKGKEKKRKERKKERR